jgi:Icc-related predicted phosphoesterase
MKLLLFSDIHNDFARLRELMNMEADYYLAAGDTVTWERGYDEAGELLRTRGERVLMLPGNHESAAGTAALCRKFGLRDFHEKSFEMAGFHLAGLGYSSPTPFATPGEYSEPEMARRLKPFAALDPLILVCHSPPKGTRLDRVKPGVHAGSQAVADFIAKNQPRLFFCGHIHEGEGVEERIGSTVARNVGKKGYLLDFDKLEL